jgi:hypothetical protein
VCTACANCICASAIRWRRQTPQIRSERQTICHYRYSDAGTGIAGWKTLKRIAGIDRMIRQPAGSLWISVRLHATSLLWSVKGPFRNDFSSTVLVVGVLNHYGCNPPSLTCHSAQDPAEWQLFVSMNVNHRPYQPFDKLIRAKG